MCYPFIVTTAQVLCNVKIFMFPTNPVKTTNQFDNLTVISALLDSFISFICLKYLVIKYEDFQEPSPPNKERKTFGSFTIY